MEPWTRFLAAGADPDFWQHTAAIVEDLVHMPDHSVIARRLRGARETDSMTPLDGMTPTTRVERIVAVDDAEAVEVDGGETPKYLLQALDEVSQGLIRVMPAEDALDGRTHMYRLPLGDCRIRRDADVPRIWAPIPSIESAYGIKDRYAVTSATTAVRMAAERSGRYLSPAVHIRCTDGDLRVDLIRPERRWMRAQRAAGFDWMICDPDQPGAVREPVDAELDRLQRPAVYTVDAGVRFQELAGAMTALRHHMREWVDGDEGSMTNLLLMAAAPILRLDQERAYVTQGDGQIGKSRLCDRMVAAYGADAGMAFPLAVLGQSGTALENLMAGSLTHLVALSDDFDPRGGVWQRVIGPLKILLTGHLPHPARRIGCDTIDGRPATCHYISTNFSLPIDTTQLSERRRFAFITGVTADAYFGGILPLCERYGDWLLVAVSAVAWWRRAGEHAWVAPLVTEQSLPDGVIDVMRILADQGWIDPAQIRSLDCRPADLPLRRRKKPRAACEPGERPSMVYMPPRRGVDDTQMCERYAQLTALIARLDAAADAEDAPQIAPVPDGSAVSDIHTIDDWTDAIAEAGPKIFPVHGEDGPAGEDGRPRWTAKSPDSSTLRRLTGESSWQRWARQERPGMGHVSDPSIPAWGMTLAPRYMVLDCDIPHDGDGDDGWTVLQREVSRYGSDALPRTWAVRTPSGGAHLIYRLSDDLYDQRDGGALVRTRADARTHVDTRVGGTGYVVSAGSHCAAGDYTPIDRPDGGVIPTVTPAMAAFLRRHGYIEPSASLAPAMRRDPLAGMWCGMTGGDRGQLVTGTTVRISPPHMTAGAIHDAWVGWTWGIVSRACDEQWDDRTLELVLRAGMAAVPASHDPRDTMRAITDACVKRGRSVPAGLAA